MNFTIWIFFTKILLLPLEVATYTLHHIYKLHYLVATVKSSFIDFTMNYDILMDNMYLSFCKQNVI